MHRCAGLWSGGARIVFCEVSVIATSVHRALGTLGSLCRWAATSTLVAAAGIVSAQTEQIPSSPTTLTSTADRMISYRSQEHMWQTADGATHVIVNRGPRRDRRSLALYSTHDGGVNWDYTNVSLPGSNGSSTSDGYLVGNRLHITWDFGASAIRYAELVYDPVSKGWVLDSSMEVIDAPDSAALTPAMAVDALGRQWLAFTHKNQTTGDFSIKMMRREAGGGAWVDTGFVFGPVDNLANERSGRPIATSRGMGMVFTVKAETYWAERRNEWALEQAWPRAPIYTKTEPSNDPYGTHFSVVADADSNLHMTSVDGGKVVYSRYLVSDRQWVTRILTDNIKASYVQTTLSGGNVLLISNAYTYLSVFQSADNGSTFALTQTLVHPAPVDGESYNRPRLESPAVVTAGAVPVLQQYVDGRRQRAMFFAVPVVSNPAAVSATLR
jgi:hypothetical protein